MSKNIIQESDYSIAFFSSLLSDLRYMKSFHYAISEEFSTDKEKHELNDFYKLNDITSLITICHLDLITNSKNLYLAKSDWEKIFFIKNTFLVIYETINSFHKHGKFLKSKSKINEKISFNYDEAANELKKFKNRYKYDTHINKIRNNISGHINDNFEEYYDEIINFDAERTSIMTLDFFKIINKIQNLLTELMKTVIIDTSKINNIKLAEIQKRLSQIKKYR